MPRVAHLFRSLYRLRTVLTLGALLLPVLPGWASNNNVPDWVKDAAKQPLPQYSANTSSVILLWETSYSVNPNGTATRHERHVVKILRPQGRRSAAPYVFYDKDSKLNSFHVWSIDASGHEYALKDSEMEDHAAGESFELYSDMRVKRAEPPGMDVGGIVAWEFEQSERPYLNETDWFFQGSTPRVHQVFTLSLPGGYTYATTWAHHPNVDGADLENHSYRWEMNNQAAIDLDHVPFSPASESLAARMTVYFAPPGTSAIDTASWKGIGKWYDGLAHDRMSSTPEMAAKTAELIAGKKDFFEKARAVGEYVQKNIRYVAIEVGIGGEQPHPASDIFRGGYGDCKDKATLLSAMLSTQGIHSTIVLVDTDRGVIDPEAPSTVGNHAIAAIEVPSGYESPKLRSVITAANGKRYLIFDPTWTETPFGQLEDNLQDSYALLIEGPASEVIHLPILSPDLNTIRRNASFELLADGTLKGQVTEKRFGDLAERRRLLAKDTAKEQQDTMDRTIAQDMSAVSLTGLKFESAESLGDDMVTSFHLEASNFGVSTGPLLMIRPRVFGSYGFDVDHKTRKVPIDLHETMQGHDEFDIAIPAGYVVDELPPAVKQDWGFASYESRTELQGQKLHYSRTFTLRQVTLPAAKYHEFQQMAATIGADEESQVVLKRANDAAAKAAAATASAAH